MCDEFAVFRQDPTEFYIHWCLLCILDDIGLSQVQGQKQVHKNSVGIAIR